MEKIIELLEKNKIFDENYEYKRVVYLLHNLQTSMCDVLHNITKHKTIDSTQFVELLTDSLQVLLLLKHLHSTGLLIDSELIYSLNQFVEEGIAIDPYDDKNKDKLYSMSLMLIK